MDFFSKKIINFEDKFFAVDLSDLSVKVFQIEKKESVDKIRSYFSLDIPKGYIEDGKIIQKDKVAEAIKAAISKAGPKKINTKKVIGSLPESKAFLRIISIPKMKEKEVSEAIKWEIEANIPLSVDQVYYDWQFIGETKEKQRILTVAVSKEIIDDTMEVFKLSGLDVYGLEVESVAGTRSLIDKNSSKEEVSLIVDFGAKKTSLIIVEGNVPYFTSSIPFSSEGITDAISKNLNINKKEAEQIKISQGVEHSFESSSIFNAIKSLLENISTEIEKSIDFYKNISPNSSEINRVIVCGGGANLKGLVPYLTTRLCREIVMGDPWINLELGNNLPIINREKSLGYATAIGLALKKIDYGNKA